MARIVQLSDLHLFANPSEQEHIFDELVTALRSVNKQRAVDLLVITGDVFDTASVDTGVATHRFAELHRELRRALALSSPTIIVPGNHDRRRAGIIGPHRDGLFLALREALADDAWVHGCTTPFLSELMPEELFSIPLWIIAYDTTYLPHGLLSAGGAFRQEDLLYAAARIGDRHPDWPILVLMHHHLVPTPLTDLGAIELGDRTNALLRWGVERVLPGVIAHADREELTMTALGAGTALSTLHSMGRAVLVLHGHKHYATARMLNGTIVGQGDVIIVSAGSAGVAQAWHNDSERDAARLWPSFNVIELTDDL
ncbi:MAG TPA: metallophosphoesterase, partial [Polyangiaceae bacterium]|nr:metallophosphoesterase [Polyangiaceae bacterium]